MAACTEWEFEVRDFVAIQLNGSPRERVPPRSNQSWNFSKNSLLVF